MATESTPALEPEWRDDLAQEAPVTFDMVVDAFGKTPSMADPDERAAFFKLWAEMSYEWADAFIAASRGDAC